MTKKTLPPPANASAQLLRQGIRAGIFDQETVVKSLTQRLAKTMDQGIEPSHRLTRLLGELRGKPVEIPTGLMTRKEAYKS